MARSKAPRTVDLGSPPAHRTRFRLQAAQPAPANVAAAAPPAPAPPAPPPSPPPAPPVDAALFILTGDDDSDPQTPKKRKRRKQPKRPKRRGRAAPATAQTPMVLLDRDMPRRRSTRLRAAAVAFYQDFCEITHMPNACSVVQGCHCLPHCWMNENFEDLMRVVEYHFGYQYSKSLNLDTRLNIFLLKSDFHNYLDRNGLLILPLWQILDLLERLIEANAKLGLGQKILFTEALPMPADGWRYTIANLGLPESHVILRKILQPVEDGQTRWRDTSDHATYKHPFNDFPIIQSHVHPCFVLLNAYDKLKNLPKLPAYWSKEHKRCAHRVLYLAGKWFEESPPTNFRPNPALTAAMRRSNIMTQDELARDVEEGEGERLATPPPEDEPYALAPPRLAHGADGEEQSESPSASEHSSPSRKRPAAGPSRQPAKNASRKRQRRDPGPSRG